MFFHLCSLSVCLCFKIVWNMNLNKIVKIHSVSQHESTWTFVLIRSTFGFSFKPFNYYLPSLQFACIVSRDNGPLKVQISHVVSEMVYEMACIIKRKYSVKKLTLLSLIDILFHKNISNLTMLEKVLFPKRFRILIYWLLVFDISLVANFLTTWNEIIYLSFHDEQ